MVEFSDDMRAYLQHFDMGEALLSRIEASFKIVSMVAPEPIETLFVSESVDSEGHRDFDSIWMFSARFALEVHSLIRADSFDCVKIENNIMKWLIEVTDYDFIKATPRSRLRLRIDFFDTISGQLKASGENCDHLRVLLTDRISKYLHS